MAEDSLPFNLITSMAFYMKDSNKFCKFVEEMRERYIINKDDIIDFFRHLFSTDGRFLNEITNSEHLLFNIFDELDDDTLLSFFAHDTKMSPLVKYYNIEQRLMASKILAKLLDRFRIEQIDPHYLFLFCDDLDIITEALDVCPNIYIQDIECLYQTHKTDKSTYVDEWVASYLDAKRQLDNFHSYARYVINMLSIEINPSSLTHQAIVNYAYRFFIDTYALNTYIDLMVHNISYVLYTNFSALKINCESIIQKLIENDILFSDQKSFDILFAIYGGMDHSRSIVNGHSGLMLENIMRLILIGIHPCLSENAQKYAWCDIYSYLTKRPDVDTTNMDTLFHHLDEHAKELPTGGIVRKNFFDQLFY